MNRDSGWGAAGRPGGPDRRRGGFMLAEAVVVAALLLLAAQAAWWATAVQARVAAGVVDGARALDEARLVRHVVGSEARLGEAGRDWEVAGGELHLRAFRGMGFGCAVQPSDGWGVAVWGHRNPNPEKDSVLVLTADGAWRSAALVRRSRSQGLDCADVTGFSPEVWRLDPQPSDPVVGLYFERGAYRFSDGALRYRQRTRWQPLTSTSLAGDSAAFSGGVDRVGAYLGKPKPSAPTVQRRWTGWGRR